MADRDDAPRPRGYHSLRIGRIVQETHDTRSFVLEVPEGLREAFRYRAGQFCTFRVMLDEVEHLRCYSMSSAAEVGDDLTVTVKRVPGGLVSNWFHDHLTEGDAVEATVPAGAFCVHEGDRPVVALCGGSGVTPVMSILKSVLAASRRPVRVLYANRDRRSVIFDAELRALGARYGDRLEVRHHLDADGGYLDAATVAGFVSATPGADFYICGPGPFMDLVETTLLDLGTGPDRIRVERFGAAVPPPGAAGAADPGTADPGTGGGDVPESVTLILKGRRHTIAYQPGDTVLETARRGSVPAPFSCEAGNCATCMALVREGGATMRANNALTPDEVEEGWVLTCQAIPTGTTVTIEYESY